MSELHADATLDCHCGLLMFLHALAGEGVRFECANRHARTIPLPGDRAMAKRIRNWVDRRSGQLDEQHRRWDAD